MGALRGQGVRFGAVGPVLAVGEGIETMLSLRSAVPSLPCIAALSASHLAALVVPEGVRRLYLVRDDDPACHHAAACVSKRATAAGLEVRLLTPRRGDLNDDLRDFELIALRAQLRAQLAPSDVVKFDVG